MLSFREIAKKWEGIAQGKASLPVIKCLLLGILAGMFISFGALGSAVAQAAMEGGLGKFIGACVFPAGLILVVMAGAELFTGNCLMAGPASNGKVKWTGVLKNWGLVYLGNMAGAFLAAFLTVASAFLWNDALFYAVCQTALTKCTLPFDALLMRGIGCNILVCGAVWMASGTDSAGGKALCCFFPVMLFVLCGFEHSVANMFYVPLGLIIRNHFGTSFPPYYWNGTSLPEGFLKNVTTGAYLLKNLLPVTLGNLIGGAGLSVIYAKVYKD